MAADVLDESSCSLSDCSIAFLKKQWMCYKQNLSSALAGSYYTLEMHRKYLETAQAKGRAPERVRYRENEYENELRYIDRLKQEIAISARVDNEISSGQIKPHLVSETAAGITIRIRAYYLPIDMPDGNIGYFDPYCSLGPRVRKLQR